MRTTNVRIKNDGDQFEIGYDFELEGYKLRSTVSGTLKDGKLTGKYITRTVEDGSGVDSGTVTATSD